MEKSLNDPKYSFYEEYKKGKFNHSGKKWIAFLVISMGVIGITKFLSCEVRSMFDLPPMIITNIDKITFGIC